MTMNSSAIDVKVRVLIEGMDEKRVERCGFEIDLTRIDGIETK